MSKRKSIPTNDRNRVFGMQRARICGTSRLEGVVWRKTANSNSKKRHFSRRILPVVPLFWRHGAAQPGESLARQQDGESGWKPHRERIQPGAKTRYGENVF